jgi:Spy/CpxP family protein refolding chaperone
MLRRPLGVWFFALAVAAVVADAAIAQQPGGRRPGGFGFGGPGGGFGGPGGDSMSLLRSEQVQKELEILPDQLTEINKVFESSRPDFSQFQGLNDLPEEERNKKRDEIRAKMQETQKANREKINGILLPHQAERLKGITLQVRGGAALEEPDIAADLKITDEQKQKFTSAREAQREKMSALFQQGGGGGNNNDEAARTAMREKFENLRKENDNELFAILTSEQRDQVEKMKGDKFEYDRSQFGRGPGGPGGPGGQGGQRFGGRRPGGDGNNPGGGNRRPTNDDPKPNET